MGILELVKKYQEEQILEKGTEIGKQIGKEEGKEIGLDLAVKIIELHNMGITNQDIAKRLKISVEKVDKIIDKLKS